MIDQISVSSKYWRKEWEYNGTVHQLFINFKETSDSVMTEALYNIFIEFEISRKLVGLTKMCLNETYSTLTIGKFQSDKFPVQNGLKEGDALPPLLWNKPLGVSKKKREV
jgi:hypothetical protein